MSRFSTVLLCVAAVCLLLGQAWLHLFWETPLEGAFEGRLPVKPVAVGLGAWFLFAGLMVIAWRPLWFCATVLFSSIFPLTLLALSDATTHEALRDQIASLTGAAVLVFTPLVLLIGARLTSRGGGIFLSRFALTLSFVTFGLMAIGTTYEFELPQLGVFVVGLDRPEIWGEAVAWVAPGLEDAAQQLLFRILGGLALAACVGIWFRIIAPVASVILALLGLAGALSFVFLHLDGSLLTQLHRWAPETAIHLPLALLPIALWLLLYAKPDEDDGDSDEGGGGSGKPRNLKRRKKLQRVDPITPGVSTPAQKRPESPPAPKLVRVSKP